MLQLRDCSEKQARDRGGDWRERKKAEDYSSSKLRFTNASNSRTDLAASGPSVRRRSLLQVPAASIINPIMLLPFTRSPSFSTKTSHSNLLAIRTNIAAGRA